MPASCDCWPYRGRQGPVVSRPPDLGTGLVESLDRKLPLCMCGEVRSDLPGGMELISDVSEWAETADKRRKGDPTGRHAEVELDTSKTAR